MTATSIVPPPDTSDQIAREFIYVFHVHIIQCYSRHDLRTELVVEGVLKAAHYTGDSTHCSNGGGMAIVHVNAWDSVWVRVRTTDGKSFIGSESSFSGFLLYLANKINTSWLCVWFFVCSRLRIFRSYWGVIIDRERLHILSLCSAYIPWQGESLSCSTCCDSRPRFFRSHPNVDEINSIKHWIPSSYSNPDPDRTIFYVFMKKTE